MLATMTIQDTAAPAKAVPRACALIKEMLPRANQAKRETVPASHIIVGLQCGGSDGYSGITANPALGAAVDLLVKHGGTAILSETPEIYGAEHLLTRRAVSKRGGQKIVDRIHGGRSTPRATRRDEQQPSPATRRAGSRRSSRSPSGAVAKGGTTGLMGVYEYAKPVTAKGFVFMDTPGYDPVSATGQVAGGANMICFTTGPRLGLRLQARAVAQARDQHVHVRAHGRRHGHQLRADPRRLAHGAGGGREDLPADAGHASGEPSKSERHGFGADEFVPWYLGAVM
jgi:altronate hydrolase